MFKELAAIILIGLLGILPILAKAEIQTWHYEGSWESLSSCWLEAQYDTNTDEWTFLSSFVKIPHVSDFPTQPGTYTYSAYQNQHHLKVEFQVVRGAIAPVSMEYTFQSNDPYMANANKLLLPKNCYRMREVKGVNFAN